MTPWFMSNEFGSLALSSKVVVVMLHVFGVVLIVLWGRRLDTKLSRRAVASPLKDKVEESKDATSGQYKDYGVQKPFKKVAVWQEPSSKVCDATGGVALYCPPDNNRDNRGQNKFPIHVGRIIDKLKTLCQSIKRRTRTIDR